MPAQFPILDLELSSFPGLTVHTSTSWSGNLGFPRELEHHVSRKTPPLYQLLYESPQRNAELTDDEGLSACRELPPSQYPRDQSLASREALGPLLQRPYLQLESGARE